MKTNEWLALFLQENRADFVQLLLAEANRLNLDAARGAAEQVIDALEQDFAAEACGAAPASLLLLSAGDAASALTLWGTAEQKLTACVASEQEMTGGARRLAYLRISDYSAQLRSAL